MHITNVKNEKKDCRIKEILELKKHVKTSGFNAVEYLSLFCIECLIIISKIWFDFSINLIFWEFWFSKKSEVIVYTL